jgi:DNA-binding XRE family transcriptional regulator
VLLCDVVFLAPFLYAHFMNKAPEEKDATTEKTSKDRTPDPLCLAIGTKIRKLRQARGVAQETFAYDAGLNRAWYGSVERGRYNITATNLARIAHALGVEVGELFPSREELNAFFSESPPKD